MNSNNYPASSQNIPSQLDTSLDNVTKSIIKSKQNIQSKSNLVSSIKKSSSEIKSKNFNSNNNNIMSLNAIDSTSSINVKDINFNFDAKKNKELLLNNINRNSSNNMNSNQPYTNSLNNSIDSKSYSLSFNKMYHALKKNNPSSVNQKEVLKGSQKKRNIYFQLVSKELVAIEPDFFLEPALMTIIKELGGRFDRESRLWYAPYRNYIQIFSNIKDCSALGETSLFPITNLPIEVLSNINYSILKFSNDIEKIQIDYSKDRIHSIFELPSSMLTNLYEFQKVGIEFGIKKKGRMLLADEMGVGKTIQAIGISGVFKENWPVLIICPSSLKYNWRDEISNWLKDIVAPDEIQMIKKSKDSFKKDCKFFIISYDLSIRMADKIEEKNFQFAIADEAHYLKSRDSKRSKLMVPILQKCKRVLLLSGTPILAKPVEIYPLLKILRPDLFKSFKSFGSRYCDPKHTMFGIDWNGATNSKELHYILSNLMIRRLKKDVLSELPPKKRQKVEIQTDGKIINQIRVLLNKSGKTDLENDNLLSRVINQEDLNDLKKGEDDQLSCFTKAYSLTGKAKLIGILDYVSYLLENNCKFLIFAHHREVLDGIEEAVNKSKVQYIRIDGEVSNEKRHIAVNTFQSNDNCLVAILGITACATGLTLTKASTVVFAEMHFTPAVMMQAEDRAHRIGQEHNCVNVHYLYGTETVDEIIFPKLREKFFVVSSTLDDKKLDMDVEKIKSGCVGDFQTKNKNIDGERKSDCISGNNKVLNLEKNKEKNKNKTLVDYFKKTSDSQQTNNIQAKKSIDSCMIQTDKIDDDIDNILEGILKDEEFVKSLTNSEIKVKQNIVYEDVEEEDNTTNFTNINLHHGNIRRDRRTFDNSCNEYSLLEKSNNSIDIQNIRKVDHK
jgi:SWI/SNF-related matrix-associated actin-dependent regulator 1 of chromatin subfamily A